MSNENAPCPVCGIDHSASAPDTPENPMKNRLQYKSSMLGISGMPEEKAAATAAILERHAEAINAFKGLESRNREGEVPGRILQNYYCIGCDVPNGALRAQIFGLAAYPLHREVMQELTGNQLTLQCYFPQTYEKGAGLGPGGIIGTVPVKTDGTPEELSIPDTTASRALKYWNWVDSNVPPYLPEAEAEIALWKLSYIAFPQGKYWLGQLEDLPEKGLSFPPELAHDLHALLGVPAMQRLVHRHLGRDIVLLDATRIIHRSNLRWDMALA